MIRKYYVEVHPLRCSYPRSNDHLRRSSVRFLTARRGPCDVASQSARPAKFLLPKHCIAKVAASTLPTPASIIINHCSVTHKQSLTMVTHELEQDPKYDNYDYPTTSPNVQSGHPGHTTKQQDAQIFQLRTQLEQAGYTERLDTLTMVRISAGESECLLCF